MRALGWRAGTAGIAAMFLAFMVLPIVALLVTLPIGELAAGITHPSVLPALKLSLVTTFTSLVVTVVFGTPLAWLLGQQEGRASRVIEMLVRLPVVMPPAVAGVALLLAFGRMGLVGSWLSRVGVTLPFSTAAVIVAQVFVSAPFYLQAAISAFRGLDREQIIVARSLGASPARVFFRVALPAAVPSLVAGAAMAWARALGEFGATLMFAGNLGGKTQTLTLAVYSTFQSDMRAAQAISIVLVAVAFVLLLALTLARRSGRRESERGDQ